MSSPQRYVLSGGLNMRKNRSGRNPRMGTSTTSGRLTHVRDPRATARFSLDEMVGWDEGDRVVVGTVVGFVEDDTMAKIRLTDGSVVLWPTFSARMKRIQTGTFQEEPTDADAFPSVREDAIRDCIQGDDFDSYDTNPGDDPFRETDPAIRGPR